jgi:hypothetical protein
MQRWARKLLCEILKCVIYADPKRSTGRGIECGMQKNKDEISELNKHSTAMMKNIMWYIDYWIIWVTQLQYRMPTKESWNREYSQGVSNISCRPLIRHGKSTLYLKTRIRRGKSQAERSDLVTSVRNICLLQVSYVQVYSIRNKFFSIGSSEFWFVFLLAMVVI